MAGILPPVTLSPREQAIQSLEELENGVSLKEGKIKKLNGKLKFGIAYKTGKWVRKDEFFQSVGNGSSLAILTRGKIINFVAKSVNNKKLNIKIKLNDKFIKHMTISKPQLYEIIKLNNNKINKLTLITKPNLAVYSFSFQ